MHVEKEGGRSCSAKPWGWDGAERDFDGYYCAPSGKQKAALLLRVNEELSYSEIGIILSVSVSSGESLLFRAREEPEEAAREKLEDKKWSTLRSSPICRLIRTASWMRLRETEVARHLQACGVCRAELRELDQIDSPGSRATWDYRFGNLHFRNRCQDSIREDRPLFESEPPAEDFGKIFEFGRFGFPIASRICVPKDGLAG